MWNLDFFHAHWAQACTMGIFEVIDCQNIIGCLLLIWVYCVLGRVIPLPAIHWV
jgi:hypothetical protein